VGLFRRNSAGAALPLKETLKEQRHPINPPIKISQGYEAHKANPIYTTKPPAWGVDYAVPSGTPVKAICGGMVKLLLMDKGLSRGYGNCIVLGHKKGYETLYAHLSAFHVIAGERIKADQIIGYSGKTGTTGPHLHLELRKDNMPIDPLKFESWEEIEL